MQQNYYYTTPSQNPHGDYGRTPAASTSRLHPQMKPEVQYNEITISPPTTIPQPNPLTTLSYDFFEMPKRVSQPYQFATEQPTMQHDTRGKCPNCFNCVSFFRLKNDTTTSVFCQSCHQPYHICPIHNTCFSGMGPSKHSTESKQCQCVRTQSFLNEDAWNSCFNK